MVIVLNWTNHILFEKSYYFITCYPIFQYMINISLYPFTTTTFHVFWISIVIINFLLGHLYPLLSYPLHIKSNGVLTEKSSSQSLTFSAFLLQFCRNNENTLMIVKNMLIFYYLLVFLHYILKHSIHSRIQHIKIILYIEHKLFLSYFF